ncbi:exostosin family protein [Altericista sp. CCNU0014]|uniref:exostosin domain-containing protein n=1 Tax=Altericista sp. CCNU0014 TaxID=3082949 RepID=UPI003850DEAC
MNQVLTSQYYLLRNGQAPLQWNIFDPKPRAEPELFWTQSDYCAKVLQVLEKTSEFKHLTFYITFDRLDELPSYGKNVVVIMVGDEACRIPLYFYKVLAVFKPYGTKPFLGCNPFLNPSYINCLSLLQFLKSWINCLPGLWNFGLNRLRLGRSYRNNLFTIPLGYYKQLELPIKTFEARQYDIFFAGSVDNDTYIKGSLKDRITQWLKPPKTLSRKQMISNLNSLKSKHPELNIRLSLTPGFFSTEASDSRTYSEQLMNSKICLVPRGTSFETYRFFEAMRYGCVVISEALPSRWFYDKSPAVSIKNWHQLGLVVQELMENRELMFNKHREALMWWRNKCSPEVTGQYIIQKLRQLTYGL